VSVSEASEGPLWRCAEGQERNRPAVYDGDRYAHFVVMSLPEDGRDRAKRNFQALKRAQEVQ